MAVLSINELTTYRWTFEEDVQNYVAAGVPAIGVWRQKLSDYGDEKGIELISESGLQVSSLLWAGGFTGSDGRSYRESIQDAREAIRLASALKAGCLVIYSGGRGGHTHNHARRLLRGALDELLPVSADAGVTLAIEPMHTACASEWTFIQDLDEALQLLGAYGSERLKIAFDTYHHAHDMAVVSRLSEVVSQIALVQLGDARQPPVGEQNRCRLGDGSIPLAEIVRVLRRAGYDGYFEVELMGEEIEACDYRDLLRQSCHVTSTWMRDDAVA